VKLCPEIGGKKYKTGNVHTTQHLRHICVTTVAMEKEYVFEVLCFLKKYKSAVQKKEQIHDHNARTNMNL